MKRGLADLRAVFAETHPEVFLLDGADSDAVARYLIERGFLDASDAPVAVERAGNGNMNLTLRVRAGPRSLIVKQGRPWVERYDHIEAPWNRTLFEAAFYEFVSDRPAVAGRLPALRHVDRHNHVLVLEDLGTLGDFTSMYADGAIGGEDVCALLEWLSSLARVRVREPGAFANRDMRRLNHEHIFGLPLQRDNGLDLERITPGLLSAARDLQADLAYVGRVAALGAMYLADGTHLVHGDYFPGSWMHTAAGVRIIDLEFGFCGDRTFDYGVMLAHCALAHVPIDVTREILARTTAERLDEERILGFAGVEIMRRLIGVAQLPLRRSLDDKQRLLELSMALVVNPMRAWTCWP